MNQEYFWRLVTRVLSGEASESEKHELSIILATDPEKNRLWEIARKKWNTQFAFRRYDIKSGKRKLRKKLDSLKREEYAREVKMYSGKKRLYWAVAAAISLITIFSIALINNNKPHQNDIDQATSEKMAEIIVPEGNIKKVMLPDSSKVWLNAGSSIRYAESFDTRYVELEGEAFFDVVRNEKAPFSVKTNSIKVRVLGTSFNVNEYKESNVSVAVASGLVSVQLNTDSVYQELLNPNEGVRISETGKLQKKYEDIEAAIAWREGKLIFRDIPMSEIIPRLERWYGVSIGVKNSEILKRKFSGTFHHETLENILMVMHHAICIDFSIDGERVSIINSNCQ